MEIHLSSHWVSEMVWPLQIRVHRLRCTAGPREGKGTCPRSHSQAETFLGFSIGIQMDGFAPCTAATVGGEGFCMQREGAEWLEQILRRKLGTLG